MSQDKSYIEATRRIGDYEPTEGLKQRSMPLEGSHCYTGSTGTGIRFHHQPGDQGKNGIAA